MYIAMNRFKVVRGHEEEFEDVWISRERHLNTVPGYLEFNMLKGAAHEDHTLYASHTVWDSEENFIAWTRSEAFRAAHKGAGDRKHMYLEGPHFEGFEVILTEKR
ncbi:antibiotic biosynthesis monooxygenase [Pseudovibrio sp. SPO723]|uniref:antibiotic biosynthesis monooxygenase family protein n=1 Tax=Nesiotobacter zosterae TaxID=392721 RepID=UPI0029C5647B|nr:antibiotic biosynthesis monooxygenase [Pseudovibrio sp. SPO723]MDX5594199.1 antibiotic biosynthesis monooxygenase [Pseudovibrio sp. SPO723]